MAGRPLSIIADVTITSNAPQVQAPTFNTGCVIGPSPVIPTYGANSRAREYLQANWSQAMLGDGFTSNDPEYIVMQMYFGQNPPPQRGVVGRQDLTAIQTAVPHAANGGTGYVVGDIVSVTQPGASNGQLRVSTIGTNGVVTGLTTLVGQQGTSYSIATGLSTTGGTGTGLEVDITAVGETPLQAFQAVRASDATWYIGMVTDATDADHIAISAWTLSQVGTMYMATTAEAAVANATPNNVAATIFAANSQRTWMRYATTQSGVYPNQAYATAMEMGCLLAANTQLANSAFTAKFSAGVQLTGGPVEPVGLGGLSDTQISNIENVGVNIYLPYGSSFQVLEQGVMMAEGVFFDQIINRDVLAANIQTAVLNLLTSRPKINQNDTDQQLLIQAVETQLDKALSVGYISAGVWDGQTILNLTPGTALPNGYKVQSPKYADYKKSNPGDYKNRIAPPIYVALIEGGAVHFVTIAISVQI